MNWSAVGNKIVVKKLKKEEEEQTISGLFLVNKQDSASRGEVVSVGSGEIINGSRVPLEVNVGDVVLYDDKYGTDIGSFHTSHSNDYMVLHEQDILAIIDE